MTNFEFLKASIAEHGMRDECLIWTRGLSSTGYPAIWNGHKLCSGNRLVCELTYGPSEPGMHALHGPCNNPACYAPAHVRWGTVQQNVGDRDHRDGTTAKGDRHYSRTNPEKLSRGIRHGAHTKPEKRRRGETHGMSVLTEKDVIEIRSSDSKRTKTYKQIAEKYDVSVPTVFKVLNNKTWKHLLVEATQGCGK